MGEPTSARKPQVSEEKLQALRRRRPRSRLLLALLLLTAVIYLAGWSQTGTPPGLPVVTVTETATETTTIGVKTELVVLRPPSLQEAVLYWVRDLNATGQVTAPYTIFSNGTILIRGLHFSWRGPDNRTYTIQAAELRATPHPNRWTITLTNITATIPLTLSRQNLPDSQVEWTAPATTTIPRLTVTILADQLKETTRRDG
jgi:hypothetical protein